MSATMPATRPDYDGRPEHAPWCDTTRCHVGEFTDDEYAAHYGHEVPVPIDLANCGPWREPPEGEPELKVRPVHISGHPGVEINAGDVRTIQSTSGCNGVSMLTVAEARHFAQMVLWAADRAEEAYR